MKDAFEMDFDLKRPKSNFLSPHTQINKRRGSQRSYSVQKANQQTKIDISDDELISSLVSTRRNRE